MMNDRGVAVKIPFFVICYLLLVTCYFIPAQEIVTADRYMEQVSGRYAEIKDYEADATIVSGTATMTGALSYLSPNYLRIDFTEPQEQVICFNGDILTVYLPGYRAVLSQEVTSYRSTPAAGASLASAQGLALLRRNYVPSFVTGPDPSPLDADSQAMAVQIRLTRRNVSEGFREIVLYIEPESLLIVRIEGRTIADSLVRFDFANIRTNVGIPEGRFLYDSPASANMYNNFLFRDTE
jgi:outer membrane lipoprotein-sorting protein